MQPVLIFLWRVSGRIAPSFFFSNYDIFISPPLVSYILSKGHEAFLEWKKGFEIFPFSPRSNFLPHSSLLRGVFLSEGGTCKVDVSRNKIKLKIASIVAVSFVILRHFRARGETTLQRRWCGNRSPLARKRMRPKKNRYRLYRPSFVGNIVRASVCRGWEKE